MTLTEFLLARIAEDEYEANTCLDQYARGDGGSTRRWRIVLAECKAKRSIIELHDRPHECSTYDHTGEVDNCTWCLDGSECSTLLALARVYSEDPEFDSSWA